MSHVQNRLIEGESDDGTSEIIGKAILAAHRLENPLSMVESFQVFRCKNETTGYVRHYKVKDVPPTILTWMLDLMERNMKDMYEKSQGGWDAEDKKVEMTDLNSRYLIAFINDVPLAFSHFQFDMDYGRQVLYCYEIQLESSVRAIGLGKHIMETLENVAQKANIPLIVLTVFKHNPRAKAFFSKIGYKIDITNPSKKERSDYFILSKRITAQDSS